MNRTMKKIICLILLSVLLLGLLSGCRKSPLLEQVTYVILPQEKPKENTEVNQKEEKEEKPAEKKADRAAAVVKHSPQPQLQPAEKPQGNGDAEYGADLSGKGEGLPQVPTRGGITAEVPQSMYMVTTVSEATQSPHWKSSIDYSSGQYSGERQDGYFEGQGTYSWSDGEKYEGQWRSGMYDGQGTYCWINGDQYEGQWKTEVFDGEGTYTWASGSYYSGQWKDGVKEGQGTYHWANGDSYTGEWKAGVKEGRGTYTWADGSVYDGEWKYGIKEGQGTYKGADGQIFEGSWTNDKFAGN